MYAFDFNEYLQYSTVQYIYSNLILLLHEYNSLVSNVEWLLCFQCLNEREDETLIVDKLFKLEHCSIIICSGSINPYLILNMKEEYISMSSVC
jgi:hypothetical protein